MEKSLSFAWEPLLGWFILVFPLISFWGRVEALCYPRVCSAKALNFLGLISLDKPSICKTWGFLAVGAKLLPLHFSLMEKMLNGVVGRWCHLRALCHNSQSAHLGVGRSHTQGLLLCFPKALVFLQDPCSPSVLLVPVLPTRWLSCCVENQFINENTC